MYDRQLLTVCLLDFTSVSAAILDDFIYNKHTVN